jgi:hypothetical protein
LQIVEEGISVGWFPKGWAALAGMRGSPVKGSVVKVGEKARYRTAAQIKNFIAHPFLMSTKTTMKLRLYAEVQGLVKPVCWSTERSEAPFLSVRNGVREG